MDEQEDKLYDPENITLEDLKELADYFGGELVCIDNGDGTYTWTLKIDAFKIANNI